ncbi:hypothetical protein, partial [uncultured Helicobacter sp.]|uniref:hypothetical protein n=1 Tax=uncultured Helicobacter sp. TaxID=175537 RepID=UPI002602C692
MPSLAFSSESNEALNQLLASAPQSPSDSKTQKMENYSPVVDLRTSREKTYDQTFDNGFQPHSNHVFNKNTNIFVGDITALAGGDINVSFTANNNSLVTMDFNLNRCVDAKLYTSCGGFEGNYGYVSFSGNGTFVLNVQGQANQNYQEASGFFDMVSITWEGHEHDLDITSSMIFKASGNVGSFLRTTSYNSGIGKYIINSPYLEIDMDNNGANKNTNKYFLYAQRYGGGYSDFYINANESNPSQANDPSSILKITGSIMSAMTSNIYAHFSNASSF